MRRIRSHLSYANVISSLCLFCVDLAPAARGARAYGRVEAGGTLTRRKNATVLHASTGVYCITLASNIAPGQRGAGRGAGFRRQLHLPRRC
jgi:hypothetical protein